MTSDIVTGVIVAILTVVLTLWGQRWVSNRGKVRCDIRWSVGRGAGDEVQERQLAATFLNRKAVPVTVWDMRVEFYKEGKPLGAQEHPYLEFAGDHGGRQLQFELTTLHPRIAVKRTVFVSPGHNEHRRQKAVEEADRIVFVTVIEGAKDIRTRLDPWNEHKDQEKRC